MENMGGKIVIRVAGSYVNAGIQWYSILDCDVVDYVHKEERKEPRFGCSYKIPKRYNVKLPVCFLKEVNVNETIKVENIDLNCINNKDYMLPKDEKELEVFFSPMYNKIDGIKHVEEFWRDKLPANIQSEELYKKLFYIMRIVTVICAVNSDAKKKIEGIIDIVKEINNENKSIWRKVSSKIYLINNALEKGKVIGPLGETVFSPGWKIISMIYAMIWCNSNISSNCEEMMAVIEIMEYVMKFDSYDEKVYPFCANMQKKLKRYYDEKWVEGWIIIYLFTRNQQWYCEYISDILASIDVPKFSHEDFERIFDITKEWKWPQSEANKQYYERNMEEIEFEPELKKWLNKNLLALSQKEYNWLMGKLVVSDRSNVSKNRYQLKNNFINTLQPLFKPMLSSYYHLLQSIDDSNLFYRAKNYIFWLFVERILYNYFGKIEIPYCNNLDFISKEEILGRSYRGNENYSVFCIANIMKKAATMRSINAVDEFSYYEKIYRILTAPYKLWILHNYDNETLKMNDELLKKYFKRLSEGLNFVLTYAMNDAYEFQYGWFVTTKHEK